MLLAILIVATLLMGAFELYLYHILRKGCGLRRPVKSTSWEQLPNEPVAPFDPDSPWISELGEIALLPDEQARAIAGMTWLMNRVDTVDAPVRIGSPEQMLAAIESGSGALCGQMARLFRHVLASLGLPSRTVYLQRNPFDCHDCHTQVEVMIMGRWVLFDPTFNLMFRDAEGRLLNAFEIKEKIFLGKHSEVRPDFLGEVRFPPRIDKYYIGLGSLFCNVYVLSVGSAGWGRLPPMRYFMGPRVYYVPVGYESDRSMVFWHQLYALTVLLLPVGIALLVAAAVSVLILGG